MANVKLLIIDPGPGSQSVISDVFVGSVRLLRSDPLDYPAGGGRSPLWLSLPGSFVLWVPLQQSG